MKFSKETIAVLKNFATINSGIVLTPGNFVMTCSIIGTTYADTTIQDEIDNELAIYDLSGFLSVLSLGGERLEDDYCVDADEQLVIAGRFVAEEVIAEFSK